MHTIMLVEDYPNQRLLCQMELADEGYLVILASEGREALKKVKEEHPDLMVLGLKMPGMDGIELLRRVMDLNPNLPVIIYSGYQGLEDSITTWVADAHLVKSSNLDLLKREIRLVLSERLSQGRWPIWPDSTGGWAQGDTGPGLRQGHWKTQRRMSKCRERMASSSCPGDVSISS